MQPISKHINTFMNIFVLKGMDTVKCMLRKFTELGWFQIPILLLLLEKPLYGYELKKIMFEIRGKEPSSGVVYPALQKLEAKGYIRGYWDESEGRRRKMYVITEKGKREVEKLVGMYERTFERLWMDFEDFWTELLELVDIKLNDEVFCSTIFPLSMVKWFINYRRYAHVYLYFDQPKMRIVSSPLIYLAKKRKLGKIEIASQLPQKEFDKIICLIKLPNIKDPISCLAKCLKPRGVMLLALTKEIDNIWIKHLAKRCTGFMEKFAYTIGEVKEKLENYVKGYEIFEKSGLIIVKATK